MSKITWLNKFLTAIAGIAVSVSLIGGAYYRLFGVPAAAQAARVEVSVDIISALRDAGIDVSDSVDPNNMSPDEIAGKVAEEIVRGAAVRARDGELFQSNQTYYVTENSIVFHINRVDFSDNTVNATIGARSSWIYQGQEVELLEPNRGCFVLLQEVMPGSDRNRPNDGSARIRFRC